MNKQLEILEANNILATDKLINERERLQKEIDLATVNGTSFRDLYPERQQLIQLDMRIEGLRQYRYGLQDAMEILNNE